MILGGLQRAGRGAGGGGEEGECEAMSVLLSEFSPPVVVGCVYRPPEASEAATGLLMGAMEDAARKAREMGGLLVVGGDANMRGLEAGAPRGDPWWRAPRPQPAGGACAGTPGVERLRTAADL